MDEDLIIHPPAGELRELMIGTLYGTSSAFILATGPLSSSFSSE